MTNRQLYEFARSTNNLVTLQAIHTHYALPAMAPAAWADIEQVRVAVLAHLLTLPGANNATFPMPITVVSIWRVLATVGNLLLVFLAVVGLFLLRLTGDTWQTAMIVYAVLGGAAAIGLLVYVLRHRATLHRADRSAGLLTIATIVNLMVLLVALIGRLIGFDAWSANIAIGVVMVFQLAAYIAVAIWLWFHN